MTPEPWSAAERSALLGLLAIVALGLVMGVHPWYDPINDALMYIATAQSLAAGEGYTYMGIPFQVRPPGIALMLAPIVAARGVDFYAFNLLISAWGGAAVLAVYVWLRPRWGWLLALLTALAVWFTPGFQRYATQVVSDVPGLACVLFGVLVARWADRAPSWRRELLLGATLGAAGFVRTAVVLLIPAVIGARVLRGLRHAQPVEWRSLLRLQLVAPAVVLALQLTWGLSTAAVVPEPPADQTRNYSYGTAMWHKNPRDPASRRLSPAEILARAPVRAEALAHTLGRRLWVWGAQGQPANARDWALFLTLVAALAAVAWRRAEAAELYALAYLAVVLIYFGYNPRLAIPLWAFGLAALVDVLREFGRRRLPPRASAAPAVALLLVLMAVDFAPRRSWDRIEQQHAGFEARARAVAAAVESDATLGAYNGRELGLFLGQPVYMLRYGMKDDGGSPGAERLIDKYSVNTVIVGTQRREQELGAHLEETYGAPKLAGNDRIWRVR